MSALLLRRLRDKIWPESLPPHGAFDGKTVLITGATSGLGFAAAQHFSRLGATVILTSRDIRQGETTRREIEHNIGLSQGKIHVMHLDMNMYSSCLEFFEALKRSEWGKDGIDCAILNAGVINSEFMESAEGWEQTIQVNTLSTTLLGLLVLGWMKKRQDITRPTPHLVFVASRDHLDPDILSWPDWSKQEGILRHFSNKENWPKQSVDTNYAISKLMLMYAIEDMCEQAVAPDGTVQVIINSVCPGLVSTNIARSIVAKSKIMAILVPIYLGALGKSADYGSRFYLIAALASQEQHGKNIQSLFTDEEYLRLAIPNLKSHIAQAVKKAVTKEIMEELRRKVPGLDDLMASQRPGDNNECPLVDR